MLVGGLALNLVVGGAVVPLLLVGWGVLVAFASPRFMLIVLVSCVRFCISSLWWVFCCYNCYIRCWIVGLFCGNGSVFVALGTCASLMVWLLEFGGLCALLCCRLLLVFVGVLFGFWGLVR